LPERSGSKFRGGVSFTNRGMTPPRTNPPHSVRGHSFDPPSRGGLNTWVTSIQNRSVLLIICIRILIFIKEKRGGARYSLASLLNKSVVRARKYNVHVSDLNRGTKGDKPSAGLKKCPQKFQRAARKSVMLLRHSIRPLGAFALTALLLTGGQTDAASATAAINVSLIIEARCVVSLTDTTGRDADLGRNLAVHCTDATPYRVLSSDGPSGQGPSPGALPPAGAKPLEIAF
jgi:hypothetical protein